MMLLPLGGRRPSDNSLDTCTTADSDAGSQDSNSSSPTGTLSRPTYRPSSRLSLVCTLAVTTLAAMIFSRTMPGSSSSFQEQVQEQEVQEERRSFVCITGQLSRLELRNKIATVLEPLRAQAGLPPDVALVLDDRGTTYTTNDQRVSVEYQPPYSTYQEAVDELRRYGYNVVTDGTPYHQVDNPIVPDDYLEFLQRRGSFDDAKHAERARNNVRMLESWSQCYNAMTSNDADRVASYDVVVRIREDTGFLSAIDMKEAVEELRTDPTALLSNGCRALYQGTGMNDKFAILSRHAAHTYFTAPFHNLYAQPMTDRMKNTERYTWYTYTNAGLNVVPSQSIMHVVKLITDDNADTMLFAQERKKLAKHCGIEVKDDSKPSGCRLNWDKRRGLMEVSSNVCWPYETVDVLLEEKVRR